MTDIIFVVASVAVAGWYLSIQLPAAHRRKAGRCARCGVMLHPVDAPATWVHDSHGQSSRVCRRCAQRTRYGWLVLTAVLIFVVLAATIAIRFGWLANG